MDDRTLTDALTAALESLQVRDQDGAAVQLARTYAERIDGTASLLAKLGPQLLAVLDALAMTPRGRAALLAKGGAPGEHQLDAVGARHVDDCDCLPCQRIRRADRVNGPAAVDTTTS